MTKVYTSAGCDSVFLSPTEWQSSACAGGSAPSAVYDFVRGEPTEYRCVDGARSGCAQTCGSQVTMQTVARKCMTRQSATVTRSPSACDPTRLLTCGQAADIGKTQASCEAAASNFTTCIGVACVGQAESIIKNFRARCRDLASTPGSLYVTLAGTVEEVQPYMPAVRSGIAAAGGIDQASAVSLNVLSGSVIFEVSINAPGVDGKAAAQRIVDGWTAGLFKTLGGRLCSYGPI